MVLSTLRSLLLCSRVRCSLWCLVGGLFLLWAATIPAALSAQTIDETPPTSDWLTVSSPAWTVNGQDVYAIEMQASDAGSGLREMRAYINLRGSNNDQRRGYLFWRKDRNPIGSRYATSPIACSGGGFADKHNATGGGQHIILVDCASSGSDAQRVVTFYVRPETSFGEIAENDIAMWARDVALNRSGWLNFDLNFSSSSLVSVGSGSTSRATIDFEGFDGPLQSDSYASAGIELSGFEALAAPGQSNGCNGTTRHGFVPAAPGIINVPSGFSSVSFSFAKSRQTSGTVEIWSGLNGTGTRLFAGDLQDHPNNGVNAGPCLYDVWLPSGTLSYAGRSIVLTENDSDPLQSWTLFDNFQIQVNEVQPVVDAGSGFVLEGSSSGMDVSVSLPVPPAVNTTVEVTLERTSTGTVGETLLVAGNPTAVFNSANWDQPQALTIIAQENNTNNDNNQVMFRLSKTGGSSAMLIEPLDLAITEIDDDVLITVEGPNVISRPAGISNGLYFDLDSLVWQDIEMAANPSSGFMFDGWSIVSTGQGVPPGTLSLSGGVSANPARVTDITPNGGGGTDFTISPAYVPINSVEVTVQASGSGTVVVNGISTAPGESRSVPRGQDIPLQASPAPGWAFAGWISTPGGVIANNSATSTTINTQQATIVTANFSFAGVSLDIQTDGNGTATPSGVVGGLQSGQSLDITVDASPGQIVDRCEVLSGDSVCRVVNPDLVRATVQNHSVVQIRFRPIDPGRLGVRVSDLNCASCAPVIFEDGQSPFGFLDIEKDQGGGSPRQFMLEFYNAGDTPFVPDRIALQDTTFAAYCLRSTSTIPSSQIDPCPQEQSLPAVALPTQVGDNSPSLFLDFGNPSSFPDDPADSYEAQVATLEGTNTVRPVFGLRGSVVGNAPATDVDLQYFQETGGSGVWAPVPQLSVGVLDLGVVDASIGGTFRFRIINRNQSLTFQGDLQIVNSNDAGLSPNVFGFTSDLTNSFVVPAGGNREFTLILKSDSDSTNTNYRGDLSVGRPGNLRRYAVEVGTEGGVDVGLQLLNEFCGDPAVEGCWDDITIDADHSLFAAPITGSEYLFRIVNPSDSEGLRVSNLKLGQCFSSTDPIPQDYELNTLRIGTGEASILPGSSEQFILRLKAGAETEVAIGGDLCFSYRDSRPEFETFKIRFSARRDSNIDPNYDPADLPFDIDDILPTGPLANFQTIPLPPLEVGQEATLNIALRNSGPPTSTPLSVSVDPQVGGGFQVLQTQFTIAPGDEQRLRVRFSAQDAGVFDGRLTIRSNDPFVGELAYHLQAVVTPSFSDLMVEAKRYSATEDDLVWTEVDPDPLYYLPGQSDGGVILAMRLSASTASSSNLVIESIEVRPTGSDPNVFSLESVPSLPQQIAPSGAPYEFSLRSQGSFRTTAYRGELRILYRKEPGGAVVPLIIPLRAQIIAGRMDPFVDGPPGTGVEFLAQYGTLELTSVPVGQTARQVIRVLNSGGPTVHLDIEPTIGPGFEIVSPLSFSLPFGQLEEILIDYTSSSAGLREGELRITAVNEPALGNFFQTLRFAAVDDTSDPDPPGPPTSPDCASFRGDVCLVGNSAFTINVSPATDTGGSGINPNGYRFCRSNDTTGWAGCEVMMSTTAGTSFVVTGAHRPEPGQMRAYWVRAKDNAGNLSDWSGPLFIENKYFAPTEDTIPPTAPGNTMSPNCVVTEGGICYVDDANFTIQVSAASDPGSPSTGVNPSGYRICRSNNTTGFGGCEVDLTLTGGTSIVVSGTHRPPPGSRRAYYFHATDHAGNIGDWNGPLYVETIGPDVTGPTAPGNTTSPNCNSVSGGICYVSDANFSIHATPATDPGIGSSGVNPNGYQICRSNDTTGFGGCDVSLTTAGTTSMTVSGSHRPGPGKRRAYYFRARDNAGNWGAWNGPLYVETEAPLPDTTAPTAPGNTASPNCVSSSGGVCYVNDANFTIQVTAASDPGAGASGVNPSGYRICRSNNVTGFGGCEVTMTWAGSTSMTVSGSHRPSPGNRRAYYFHAVDNAGNSGPWNGPLYVETLQPVPDTTGPTAPGNTTSPNCTSISGGVCYVNNANFTIQVTPASDPGSNASGVNPNGYQICRSNDTTGWGGCEVNLSLNGSTSMLVTGSQRPQPGKRRAYYFRAKDNAGNWGAWNGPLYVQTN